MFVGNDDAVEVPSGLFKQREAPKGFFLPEPGIYQKTRLGGFEQRAVARTARRQNAYANADAVSPVGGSAEQLGSRSSRRVRLQSASKPHESSQRCMHAST